MEIPTKLLFKDSGDFSLYNLAVYHCLFKTLSGGYPYGYDLYFKIFPEQQKFLEYQRLRIIKGFWEGYSQSKDLGDNPLIIFDNFDIYLEEYKAAAALTLSVPTIKIMLKKKRPDMVVHNRDWLVSHYTPGEIIEIEKARQELGAIAARLD